MALSTVNVISGEQERLAYTAKRWLSTEFRDHYWNNHPLYVKLRERDNILSGGLGEQVCVNMTFADAANPTPRGVVNPLTSAPRNVLSGNTRLKMDTAQIVFNFSIDKREYRLQGSQTKMTDYVKGQLGIAKKLWDAYLMSMIWGEEDAVGGGGSERSLASLRVLMNKGTTATTWNAGPKPHPAQLCADGTGAFVAGWNTTDMGATAAYKYGRTPITTIGNINRAQAGAVNACVPTFAPTYANALAISKDSLNKLWLASGYNNESADLAITTRNMYGAVMSILQSQNYMTPSPLQKFGFTSFQYNGVDWIYDDNCPDGISASESGYPGFITDRAQVFMLNTRNLQIFTDAKEPTVTMVTPADAAVWDYQWEWYGQLVPLHLGRGLGARCCNHKFA